MMSSLHIRTTEAVDSKTTNEARDDSLQTKRGGGQPAGSRSMCIRRNCHNHAVPEPEDRDASYVTAEYAALMPPTSSTTPSAGKLAVSYSPAHSSSLAS